MNVISPRNNVFRVERAPGLTTPFTPGTRLKMILPEAA